MGLGIIGVVCIGVCGGKNKGGWAKTGDTSIGYINKLIDKVAFIIGASQEVMIVNTQRIYLPLLRFCLQPEEAYAKLE